MFMEYVDKSVYTEFTIDMYYGNDGMVKSIVPRQRIEIRAGEINKGVTRKTLLLHTFAPDLDISTVFVASFACNCSTMRHPAILKPSKSTRALAEVTR